MLTKKVLNNVYCRSRPVPTAKVLELAGSGVATGGKRGNLPPPPPTSDRTPREIDADCRSEEIFVSEKNGGWFTGFAPTFYMHRRYGGRSLVLRLRKKEGVVEVVEGVTLVGLQ